MVYSLSRRSRGGPLVRGGRDAYRYARVAGQVAASLYRNRGRIQRAAKFAAKRMSRKRKAPSRRKATPRRNTQKNKQQDKRLAKLSKQLEQSTGHMTYRKLDVLQALFLTNKQKVAALSPSSISILETVLGQCKYFDPSTPGTLITASQVAGSYSRTSHFDSVTCNVQMRNNYQSDILLKLYLCTNRDDTNTAAGTAWTNAIADNAYGSVNSTDDLGQYPSDYPLLTDLYNVKKVLTKTLKAGQTCSYFHSTGPFDYDSATADSHALAYQRQYKSFQFLVVIRGALAHDTTIANQVGTIDGGCDIKYDTVFKVSYSTGGPSLKYIYVSDGTVNPSNQFVQTHQPVADNQGYSIA